MLIERFKSQEELETRSGEQKSDAADDADCDDVVTTSGKGGD